MLYRVYLVFRLSADGSTVAVRNVLRTLTGTTLESFEPLQERLVGQVDLSEPLELDEEKVRNLLRTQAPNASGIRLEPVESVLPAKITEVFDEMAARYAVLTALADLIQEKGSGTVTMEDLQKRLDSTGGGLTVSVPSEGGSAPLDDEDPLTIRR